MDLVLGTKQSRGLPTIRYSMRGSRTAFITLSGTHQTYPNANMIKQRWPVTAGLEMAHLSGAATSESRSRSGWERRLCSFSGLPALADCRVRTSTAPLKTRRARRGRPIAGIDHSLRGVRRGRPAACGPRPLSGVAEIAYVIGTIHASIDGAARRRGRPLMRIRSLTWQEYLRAKSR